MFFRWQRHTEVAARLGGQRGGSRGALHVQRRIWQGQGFGGSGSGASEEGGASLPFLAVPPAFFPSRVRCQQRWQRCRLPQALGKLG